MQKTFVIGMGLLAAAMFAASDASAATGDWPQYGFTANGDRNNTQETILSRKTVPHLIKKWSANIQVAPLNGAVVANGIVYAGSSGGSLNALDAKTGAPVWKAATGGNISSSPAVAEGLVYLGSVDGHVYAFDAETGARRWSASINGSVVTALVVDNGVIYSGTNTGFALAIDAKTGVVKWSTQVRPYGALSAPAVAHGIAYFNSFGDYYGLDALDIRTGAVLWQQHLDNFNSHLGVPAVYRGLVITRSDSYISAFDAKTGQSRWAAQTLSTMGSIALAGGHVFLAASADLWSYDALTGKYQYLTWAGEESTETPALANGVIYLGSGTVGDQGATISAFDSNTGKLLWKDQDSDGFGTPTISNGMLYVGKGNAFTAYGLP